MYPINIIGIGQGKGDLTQKHMALIDKCDVLVGGKRHLAAFDYPEKEFIPIKGDLGPLIEILKEKIHHHKIVILASGDPLFHGIGSTLLRHFEKPLLTVHANISSVSAAFAAIKEPWHDAEIISLHGPFCSNFSFSKLQSADKIAFLTAPDRDPHYIAQGLINEGMLDFRCCVLEKLGSRDEKITWFDNIAQVAQTQFSQPNIVILLRLLPHQTACSRETHIGMDDALFKHSQGLITKSEIRSITLSRLKLIKKNHVLWDIGSGSGSVGIEASFLLPRGHVVAMEKNPDRIADIHHNIKTFNCTNVQVLNIAFPNGVDALETPDRIFIGGGGEHLENVLKTACSKLAAHGIIVINTVLVENIGTAQTFLKTQGFNPDITQIQISKSRPMPYGSRLAPLNPIWIITGSKPEHR